MKKGLTMLVAAMVIIGLICVIGSAAAAGQERKQEYVDMINSYLPNEASANKRDTSVNTQTTNGGSTNSLQNGYTPAQGLLDYDSSQPIDQGDAAWQQIAIPVNLDGTWKADVIANHDWSNGAWTISDAFEEAAANQVPYYIYSAEFYPAEIAIYISEQFENVFWG
jgi:hypothetical protein